MRNARNARAVGVKRHQRGVAAVYRRPDVAAAARDAVAAEFEEPAARQRGFAARGRVVVVEVLHDVSSDEAEQYARAERERPERPQRELHLEAVVSPRLLVTLRARARGAAPAGGRRRAAAAAAAGRSGRRNPAGAAEGRSIQANAGVEFKGVSWR
eukprot:31170-Pelagococcus_subviridis.AAC.9